MSAASPTTCPGLAPPCKTTQADRRRGLMSTGFQHGSRVPSGWSPLATSRGADQPAFSRREIQMPTSRCFSSVPPNHAQTSVPSLSTIVEAWHSGNGAFSNTNSRLRIAGGSVAAIDPARVPTHVAKSNVRRRQGIGDFVITHVHFTRDHNRRQATLVAQSRSAGAADELHRCGIGAGGGLDGLDAGPMRCRELDHGAFDRWGHASFPWR